MFLLQIQYCDCAKKKKKNEYNDKYLIYLSLKKLILILSTNP